MRPGEVRLAIDCGSAKTTAVLAWPGGWLPLLFDALPWLSSAVYAEPDGDLSTGQLAWRRAALDSGRFEPAPLRRLGEDLIKLGDLEFETADMVAATLRRVAGEAVRMAGGPVVDVRLVVPAGWGPRRCTRLRLAARRAGLGEVTLVVAPIAVAEHAVADGLQLPVGSFIAVCDVGAGVEATVLRRGPAGFEVVSTLEDADGGGRRVDQQLAVHLGDRHVPDEGVGRVDGDWWQLLASVQVAKEASIGLAAVTVAMPPPLSPVVLTGEVVEAVARPVVQRAGRLVLAAVEAAGLQPEQLTATVLAGGTAAMPVTARVVSEVVGRAPVVLPEPAVAAVRGAAQASGAPVTRLDAGAGGGGLLSGPPMPPWRRAAALLVPGAASLLLLIDFLAMRARAGDPKDVYRYADYTRYGDPSSGFGPGGFIVEVNWGELSMAAALALIACLCAASVLLSILPANPGIAGPLGSDGVQMGGGLLAATGLGLGIAGLYAVGAGQFFYAPFTPFLKWTLLPLLPLAATLLAVALLAARWDRRPADGWHEWLRFPLVSVVPAAFGMVLIEYVTWHVPAEHPLWDSGQRLGGLLIGFGSALALVQPWLWRLVAAVPLTATTAVLASVETTGVLGVIYILAVTGWWLQRLWQLAFRPPQPWPPAAGR